MRAEQTSPDRGMGISNEVEPSKFELIIGGVVVDWLDFTERNMFYTPKLDYRIGNFRHEFIIWAP